MIPFSPMRPGLSFPRLDEWNGTLPTGWGWQPKLNDERAVIHADGLVLNRHGRAFERRKLAKFAHAIDAALRAHPGQLLDVALVGIRDPEIPARVVVLDLPRTPGPWSFRRTQIQLDFALPCYDDARRCWADFFGKPGYEGIVGRRLAAGYACGDSNAMCKSKWIR